MILRSTLFKRVTIVGVGLMGGSLGMAIKKKGLAKEVVGFSTKQTTLDLAIKKKAIDVGQTDFQKAIRQSDLVILATSVDTIIKMLPKINPYLRRGCIVMDIGSAKAEIVEEAERRLSAPSFFIGAHPLVGSEKKGIAHAKEDLFDQERCVITPTDETNKNAYAKIKELWKKLGSRVKTLDPEEHDKILAYVSHLPHMISFTLMKTIPDEYLAFSLKGLRDTTRIAGSDSQLWHDICIANSKNIVKSIDEMVMNLSTIRQAVIDEDEKTVLSYFKKAKENRDVIAKHE